MTAVRTLRPLGALLALALLAIVGCGGARSSSEPRLRVASISFPPGGPGTIDVLRRELDSGPMLAPTVSVLLPGRNRFAFELFDASHHQIPDASVAVYVVSSGSSNTSGPYVATRESLAVPHGYESTTVADDPSAAKAVYVTNLPLPQAGTYVVQALVRHRGHARLSDPVPVTASSSDPVPSVGQVAPRVSTPTLRSAHGDVGAIDTRDPADDMHSVDLAGVLGKKPVVLLFSSPGLCPSRVCGPVTDITELVATEFRHRAAFVHNEIYLGNSIRPGCLDGVRPEQECVMPQVLAYHLPSEPWLFAIDRHGRIAARIEGAFSRAEAEAAVRAALAH